MNRNPLPLIIMKSISNNCNEWVSNGHYFYDNNVAHKEEAEIGSLTTSHIIKIVSNRNEWEILAGKFCGVEITKVKLFSETVKKNLCFKGSSYKSKHISLSPLWLVKDLFKKSLKTFKYESSRCTNEMQLKVAFECN